MLREPFTGDVLAIQARDGNLDKRLLENEYMQEWVDTQRQTK